MLDHTAPHEFTIISAIRLGTGHINPSATSFAVMPEYDALNASAPNGASVADGHSQGIPDLTVAPMVELLHRKCVEGGSLQDKWDFIDAIIQLWSEGKVLFPLGFIWHQSFLGELDDKTFSRIANGTGTLQVSSRSSIEDLVFTSRKKLRQKKNFCSSFYKFLLAFQLSSNNIRTLDDIKDEHWQLFANAARPNWKWERWISQWHATSARALVNALAAERGDTNLGHVITRVNYSGRGPRKQKSAVALQLTQQPYLQWVVDRFDQFIDERKLMVKKGYRRARGLLLQAFSKCPPTSVENEKTAFSRANMQIFLGIAKDWSTPETRLQTVSKVLDFASWLEDINRDEHGSSDVVVGLTNADIERFRSALPVSTRTADSEVTARPMPARLHAELKKIITEDDFAWPKSILVRNRPSHWITHLNPKTGESETVFCEVLSRMLLLMLDLPLRHIQVRRLDSGEGDDEFWHPDKREWVENRGPNAGYWRRLGAKNKRRGALRRIYSTVHSDDSITGFYVNSNKTQDQKKSFDENSGYEIPWQLTDVIDNISAMRKWQETYNPVQGPLSSKDTPLHLRSDDASASVIKILPERFHLFRYPLNPGPRGNEAPPTYKIFHQFFHEALDELETRLNKADPTNPIKIITRREPGGAPRLAIFTIHGMRSSTITTLYTEGVPIGILSKLVAGHATILMTLRYSKFDPRHVSEILTTARQKAMVEDAAGFRWALRNASFEEAAKMTARLQDDGLNQAKTLYSDAGTWSGMDIGICPNGGTLCHIGGENLLRKGGTSIRRPAGFQPVPGGTRNCVRCRFFITGLPFLIPLWGHANMLSAKASSLSIRIEQRDSQLNVLKKQRHEVSSSGQPVPEDLRRRIMTLEAEWDADMNERDQTFSNFHATLIYIEKVRAISTVESDDKLPMLLSPDGLPEVTGRESTRFELADSVVQMSRFFPSLESAELERERDQFLDRILYNGGYVPITLGSLGLEERKRAADALAAFLIGKLGAAEAENLIQGRTTLADLGLQEAIEEVARRSVGAPLTRLEMRSRSTTVLDLTTEQSS